MNHHGETIRENYIAPQDSANIELMKRRPGRLISPPSHSHLTQQQYKDECNPNVVIQKYNRTGELGRIRSTQPIYVDCTAFNFEEARERVARIEETFMEMPAMVRRRFNHDPKNLLAFLEDPKNREEAERLGLVEKKAPPAHEEEPAKAPATPAPKAKKKTPETPPEDE